MVAGARWGYVATSPVKCEGVCRLREMTAHFVGIHYNCRAHADAETKAADAAAAVLPRQQSGGIKRCTYSGAILAFLAAIACFGSFT